MMTLGPSSDHEQGGPTHSSAAFYSGTRGRFNAWFFTVFDNYIAHISRPHKRHAFGGIEAGTLVEIGAGVGANFDHVPDGSHLIAVEPNLAMHGGLITRAAERGIDIAVLVDDAHRLPLDNDSVDDVLCSLVLCTVADPTAVLAEVRRVLRPGGRFRFVEHVAAPARSPRRWLQHAVRRPWRWIYEGCDTCRETASAIGSAGFSDVDLTSRRFRRSLFIPVNTTIHGIATN